MGTTMLARVYIASALTTGSLKQGPELKAIFDTIRDDPKEIGPKFERVQKM